MVQLLNFADTSNKLTPGTTKVGHSSCVESPSGSSRPAGFCRDQIPCAEGCWKDPRRSKVTAGGFFPVLPSVTPALWIGDLCKRCGTRPSAILWRCLEPIAPSWWALWSGLSRCFAVVCGHSLSEELSHSLVLWCWSPLNPALFGRPLWPSSFWCSWL